MASLTGNKIKDTYQSLLKTNDNGQITSVSKNITDGFGSGSGLYLKDTGVTLSGSVSFEGISQSPQTNVLTYDTASGQIHYTASSAIGGGSGIFSFTSSVLDYYVDKRFTGSCGVTIGPNRTITSTNIGYLTQLSASTAGNPTQPYPDPWSAAFAASASIAAGQTTSARVIVKTGNEYTYGSSTLAQNGDMTGSLTNNLTPDVAVSQIDYNNRVFNLLSPNIEFYFEPETVLYDINKSWTQELVVYTSSNWDIAPEFKITGKGKFVLVYGTGQGRICRYATITAPRAEISIEADHLLQNMNEGWTLYGQKVNINVNKWWCYPSSFSRINNKLTFGLSGAMPISPLPEDFWNWPSQSLVYPSYSIGIPQTNINIGELRYGEGLFGGIAPVANAQNNVVFWLFHPYGGIYDIDIDTLIIKTSVSQFFRVDSCISNINNRTSRNNTLNVNINYISHSRGDQSSTRASSNLFTNYRIWQNAWDFGNNVFYENCDQNINIKEIEANGLGLIGSIYGVNMSNCNIKLNCDNYVNYGNIESTNNPSCINIFTVFSTSSLSIQAGSGSFVNNIHTISGVYKNYASSSLLSWGVSDNTNNGSVYNTLILDNFKGYQLTRVNNPTAYQDSSGSINIRSYADFFHNLGYQQSTGSFMIIKNSLLYTSGSTSTLYNGTITKTPTIILDNVLLNKDLSSDFNYEGSVNISSNINRLIY